MPDSSIGLIALPGAGPWYSTGGYITKSGESRTYQLDVTIGDGDMPSPIIVEIGYWEGDNYVVRKEPMTGSGVIDVTLTGAGPYSSIQSIYFKVYSVSTSQQVIIRGDGLHPVGPDNPNMPVQERPDYIEGNALGNLYINDEGNIKRIPAGDPDDIIGDGPIKWLRPQLNIPNPDWFHQAGERAEDATGINPLPGRVDPLVLDLDGDGVETSALGYGPNASTTYFDMDNDGFAERTGWAAGGDGLLALDKNGNGKIDNQSELFANSATHTGGFAALSALDSNKDGKITSADAQWNNLRVWIDGDSDGVTDTGELKTLSSLKITQINLNTTAHTNILNGRKSAEYYIYVQGKNNVGKCPSFVRIDN